MKEKGIKWALIGSTNMALQGINIHPRDLDSVVRLDDLKKMKNIFPEYKLSKIKELKSFRNEPAWDIKMRIGDIEGQILGEKDTGEYVSKLLANKIKNIMLDDIEIPCFTLKAEAQTYLETNRKHKADIINRFLEQSHLTKPSKYQKL